MNRKERRALGLTNGIVSVTANGEPEAWDALREAAARYWKLRATTPEGETR